MPITTLTFLAIISLIVSSPILLTVYLAIELSYCSYYVYFVKPDQTKLDHPSQDNLFAPSVLGLLRDYYLYKTAIVFGLLLVIVIFFNESLASMLQEVLHSQAIENHNQLWQPGYNLLVFANEVLSYDYKENFNLIAEHTKSSNQGF